MWSLRLTLLYCLLFTVGCESPARERVTYAPSKPLDLTGNWEVDHARSDNVQRQLNTLVRQWQREAERRARAAERGQTVAGSNLGSGRELMALAEISDLITAPELLEVVQTSSEVRIKRENSFALICQTDQPPPVITRTPFGVEECGWDGHQLFFNISLPDGLVIRHRITRSALADSLVIQTAVYSPEVAQPFTVNRVFSRFNPNDAGFRCVQTLTKGRVCTTEQPES